MAAYIDRTHTGIEGRVGRTCFTFNRPRHLLVPLFRVWRI